MHAWVPTPAYSLARVPPMLRAHSLASAGPAAAAPARRGPARAAAAGGAGASAAGGADPGQQRWYQPPPDSFSTEDFLELLRARRAAAEQGAEQGAGAAPPRRAGAVFLVGTGPGDPGLLTLKAVAAMQAADVVLYDRLVSEDILSLVNPGALCVYVGKQTSFHTRSQAEISALLAAFASEGAAVVRLKGGDPFVFGRGGEEAEALAAAGAAVTVVPGVTAAAGVAAELGVPLTHRGLATSVRFLTGHARDGGEAVLDGSIAAAADPHATLVVYMGLATLPSLAATLIERGLPPDTPALAVERGTTPRQRCVYAPLAALGAEVGAAGLVSPTLVIVGAVVALSPGWARCAAAGRALDDAPPAPRLPLPALPGVPALEARALRPAARRALG